MRSHLLVSETAVSHLVHMTSQSVNEKPFYSRGVENTDESLRTVTVRIWFQ
jgi:hypothetical protein